MKKTIILLPLAAVLALSACAGPAAPAGPIASAASTGASAGAVEEQSPPASEPAADESDEVQPFGETVTYEDGLAVSVTDKGSFRPDAYAAGGDGYDEHRLFSVRITNNTGETFDPALVSVNASGGESDGDPVFDTKHKLNGTPDGRIRDGKSVVFNYGFGLDGTDGLTVTVAPGYSYSDAVFGSD